MLRYVKTLALIFLTLLISGNAWAFIDLGAGQNKITISGYENLINGANSNPDLVDQGDIFYGVLSITSIDFSSTGPTQDWTPSSSSYLNGYFLLMVDSVKSFGDDFIIDFKSASVDPNFIFDAADFGSNTVMKFFESTAPVDYTSFATSLSTASTGSEWMNLSLDVTDTIDGGYWYSIVNTNLANVAAGTFLGTTWYGLNLVPTGYISYLDTINDGLEELENQNVNFVGNGDIESTTPNPAFLSGDNIYSFYVSDPAIVATPEPSTMLLLGAGLLGLGALARRRR